jgi:hypothetical protein
MTEIPSWQITGDWFDNCSCAVACPCTFAQAPDNGFCESVLFWHIQHGYYGDINLDGLSFVRVGRWEGDLWAGKAKGSAGIFIDDRANERQAEVLPRIFGGQVGGFRHSSPRCSPRAARSVAWSARGSPSRSRLTASSGERRSRAK